MKKFLYICIQYKLLKNYGRGGSCLLYNYFILISLLFIASTVDDLVRNAMRG